MHTSPFMPDSPDSPVAPRRLVAGTGTGTGAGTTALLGLVGLIAVFASMPVRAQGDAPAVAGRLSETSGQVWLYSPDDGEWVTALRNRPLTSGDQLATDVGARATVTIGSTVVQIADRTELGMVEIDDRATRLTLAAGSVTVRLRSSEAATAFSLRTAVGRFTPDGSGRFRFDHLAGVSSVTAYAGRLRFESDDSALPVSTGQRADLWRDGSTRYAIEPPETDDFAAWAAARDDRDDRLPATSAVSPEMTGVADLSRYGNWEQDAEMGAVWYPTQVAADWAPYRDGQWTWVAPWGWSWVDAAPWGFAPFHYGRWTVRGSRWCWVPGRQAQRPVYAPALVGWMAGAPTGDARGRDGRGRFEASDGRGRDGTGRGDGDRAAGSPTVGNTSGRPPVGWFPLGPRDVFVPGYRSSAGYVRSVNSGQAAMLGDVDEIVDRPGQAMRRFEYANRGLAQAVTVVPADVLTRQRPVGPAARQWRDQSVVSTMRSGPVTPSAELQPAAGYRGDGGAGRSMVAGPVPRSPVRPIADAQAGGSQGVYGTQAQDRFDPRDARRLRDDRDPHDGRDGRSNGRDPQDGRSRRDDGIGRVPGATGGYSTFGPGNGGVRSTFDPPATSAYPPVRSAPSANYPIGATPLPPIGARPLPPIGAGPLPPIGVGPLPAAGVAQPLPPAQGIQAPGRMQVPSPPPRMQSMQPANPGQGVRDQQLETGRR